MNTICRQYINNVKFFFPMIGKRERKFLKNLGLTINDYCADTPIDSLDTLYQDFGMPSDVVRNYYENTDLTHILHQIKRTKWIRLSLSAIMIAVFLIVSAYCISICSKYQEFKSGHPYSMETIIE